MIFFFIPLRSVKSKCVCLLILFCVKCLGRSSLLLILFSSSPIASFNLFFITCPNCYFHILEGFVFILIRFKHLIAEVKSSKFLYVFVNFLYRFSIEIFGMDTLIKLSNRNEFYLAFYFKHQK